MDFAPANRIGGPERRSADRFDPLERRNSCWLCCDSAAGGDGFAVCWKPEDLQTRYSSPSWMSWQSSGLVQTLERSLNGSQSLLMQSYETIHSLFLRRQSFAGFEFESPGTFPQKQRKWTSHKIHRRSEKGIVELES